MDENDRIAKIARQMVEEIRPKLDKALSGLRVEGLDNLDLRMAINKDFMPPRADHYVDDNNGDWLLDTSLNYDQQLQLYLRWKQGTNRRSPPNS